MTDWKKEEIEKLQIFYKQNNAPSDEIVKDNTVLVEFTKWFNARIGSNFSSKEVADQLFTLRKSGKLPRIRK